MTTSFRESNIGTGLMHGVTFTEKHLDIEANCWNLAVTDIPWQLGEGVRYSLLDTDLFVNPVAETIEEQLLSRHPRYENTVLVRDLFQCFHRNDGTLVQQRMFSSPSSQIGIRVRAHHVTDGWYQFPRREPIRRRPTTTTCTPRENIVGF